MPSTETGEPCDLTATDALRLIRSHQLSPTELLASCLRRVDATNGAVNALVARDDEAALARAAHIEQQLAGGADVGPLVGLPIAVKDIHVTAGLPTTFGATAYADHVAAHDEPLVARLRAAGGVVMGKTNVPELSIGANTVNRLHGATANPFDTQRTCGGSSGGSAVAVSCAMAPLATGSDHGGSLRIPAAYCGVAAHRSTPGTVPVEGRTITQTNYSVTGPMGRNVQDVALALSVMARRGYPDDGRPPSYDPMAFPLDADGLAVLEPVELGDVRVGVSVDLGGVLVSEAVRREFAKRVDVLGRIADVVEVPLDLTDAPGVDWQLRADVMATQYHRMAHRFDEGFNPNVRATYETALDTTVLDIAKARRRQMELFQHTNQQFADVDVILCPGVSVEPFEWRLLYPSHVDDEPVENYMAWLALSAALTVVGHPVTAIPAGLGDVAKPGARALPFGVQLVGPVYSDRRLLSVAAAVEEAFADTPATAPPTPDLAYLERIGYDDALRTEGTEVPLTAPGDP